MLRQPGGQHLADGFIEITVVPILADLKSQDRNPLQLIV
jgi:hypothetical protein